MATATDRNTKLKALATANDRKQKSVKPWQQQVTEPQTKALATATYRNKTPKASGEAIDQKRNPWQQQMTDNKTKSQSLGKST